MTQPTPAAPVRHTRSDRGSAMVEYALLISCIGIASIGAVRGLGIDIRTIFEQAAAAL